MQERVTNLEIKMTFLEQTVEELNQVIVEREKEIDQIKALLQKALDKLEDDQPETLNSQPPHY